MASILPRRSFVTSAAALAASIFLPSAVTRAQSAAENQLAPQNVVFILLDDCGVTDFGCTGSTFYETPNIDRLAKSGVRFTTAYASCPVCSPTRSALLTGKSPVRTGITNYIGQPSQGKVIDAPYERNLRKDEVTIAQALRDRAKYQTWHVGKWHLGGKGFWPTDHGYDVNRGGYNGGHPSSYFAPYKIPTLEDGPKGEYLTDRLTDESVKLIEGRDKSRPFLLSLWHYAPHTPMQAREALVNKYREKAKRLGLDTKPFDEGELFPTTKKAAAGQRVTRRRFQSDPVYAAMIESVDAGVGRVLKALDEQGLAGNTLVVLTSDNGGLSTAEGTPTDNRPYRDGKGWLYEGGIRVPLIVRDPRSPHHGATCAAPVITADFYPTLLSAARLSAMPEQHVDGVDLSSLLKDPASSGPERDLIWHYPHYGNQGGTPGAAIRRGNLKLIEFHEDRHVELYDLAADPSETTNLADKRADDARGLHETLREWQRKAGALFPTPNPDYRPREAAAGQPGPAGRR